MRTLFLRPFIATVYSAILVGSTVYANEETLFPEILPIEQNQYETQDVQQDSEYATKAWLNALAYDDSYYLKRIHNDGYSHIVEVVAEGSIIYLHDGSKWQVRNGYEKTIQWTQNDDIFIKPNISCFSFYSYVFHNRTRDQAVEVNLIAPPLALDINTLRIDNIERQQGLVLLSDGTVWQADLNDSHFHHWQIGQRMICGVNNKWRTAEFPHILINVDMRDEPYTEVMFYGYPVTR